jgi:hypothetical protein
LPFKCNLHRYTMVEAAVFLVHEGCDEGPAAVAEVGAFLLAELDAHMPRRLRRKWTHVGAMVGATSSDYKGTLLRFLRRGVPGVLHIEVGLCTLNQVDP